MICGNQVPAASMHPITILPHDNMQTCWCAQQPCNHPLQLQVMVAAGHPKLTPRSQCSQQQQRHVAGHSCHQPVPATWSPTCRLYAALLSEPPKQYHSFTKSASDCCMAAAVSAACCSVCCCRFALLLLLHQQQLQRPVQRPAHLPDQLIPVHELLQPTITQEFCWLMRRTLSSDAACRKAAGSHPTSIVGLSAMPSASKGT